MTQKFTFLIWLVLFVTSVMLAGVGVGAAIGYDFLPHSASYLIDRSLTTMAILVVFSVGVITNGLNTWCVVRQARLVGEGVKGADTRAKSRFSARGILGTHIRRLCEMAGDGSAETISQATSLNAIRNQLIRREWLVRSASSLLLTLGLVGTVLGLTDSLGGLSTTVNAVAQDTLKSMDARSETATEGSAAASIDADSNDLSVGLNQALGGMASAFLTTLFGAVLGGVCLKLLCGCTECFTEELVDRIELLTETQVLPHLRVSPADMLHRREREFRCWIEQLQRVATQEFDRVGELSSRLDQITGNFERMAEAIQKTEWHFAASLARVDRLLEKNGLVERSNGFLNSRISKIGMLLCCLVAVPGIAWLCVKFIF